MRTITLSRVNDARSAVAQDEAPGAPGAAARDWLANCPWILLLYDGEEAWYRAQAAAKPYRRQAG